jgi:hypothetical protein
MALTLDWIEVNETREIIKNTLNFYLIKLAKFSKSDNFKKQFGEEDLVPIFNDQVDERVKQLDKVIRLFESDNHIQIHNGLNEASWGIIRDSVVLYGKGFEKSETLARDELKVTFLKDN